MCMSAERDEDDIGQQAGRTLLKARDWGRRWLLEAILGACGARGRGQLCGGSRVMVGARSGLDCRLVQPRDESIKGVGKRAAVDAGSVGLLEVLGILLDEERAGDVEQVVDPSEMQDGLVDSDKDQTQVLGRRPLQRVLFLLERGVSRRQGVLGRLCDRASAVLDEDVVDQAVDNVATDGRIRLGPEHHPGRGQDLEGIQHGGD